MSSGQTGWLLLMMLAMLMIVIGFQGDLGLLIGVVFCPQYILIENEK